LRAKLRSENLDPFDRKVRRDRALSLLSLPCRQTLRRPGVPPFHRSLPARLTRKKLFRISLCHFCLARCGRNCTILRVSDVTTILDAIEQGDARAADELLPLVYEELRKLAARKMAKEAPNQTLQPTALVHEAWLRLIGGGNPQFDGRAHFFAAAAEAMRRILIEKARRKHALRHGGGQQRVDLDGLEIAAPGDDDELLAVDEALDKLSAHNKSEAELVKLRYFVGMTVDQAAEALSISARTADNYWAHARAWLFHEIKVKRQQ
jgi:RNA polymerase sigma factor (TIGR02999 family)